VEAVDMQVTSCCCCHCLEQCSWICPSPNCSICYRVVVRVIRVVVVVVASVFVGVTTLKSFALFIDCFVAMSQVCRRQHYACTDLDSLGFSARTSTHYCFKFNNTLFKGVSNMIMNTQANSSKSDFTRFYVHTIIVLIRVLVGSVGLVAYMLISI
jgi:hypothetical protein